MQDIINKQNNYIPQLMEKALEIAQKGYENYEVAVGCVFAQVQEDKQYKILVEAHNLTNKTQPNIVKLYQSGNQMIWDTKMEMNQHFMLHVNLVQCVLMHLVYLEQKKFIMVVEMINLVVMAQSQN
ncbi:Cytidine deaminase-like protein [Pseudocohnilembus persalinus]|uniref:Cytidine deaminase-like protein n=1 Tax=Pseudocohnilembus persalinus TaxID=266149 RepID=A0A0V0QKW6_PSEPJ|nr:Cytidine deaminase-like protein [Pseudocohnilembus persalinus]|eukprot:KRX02877.1 Cytidine deaminase-like protein [Pseudocohnilembus persalinus]